VIRGSLSLSGSELTSLAGLETIRAIEGSLTTSGTLGLPSFAGLDSLEVIGEELALQTTLGFRVHGGPAKPAPRRR
jgi:hypothetical protein